jgi:hypothetical protein
LLQKHPELTNLSLNLDVFIFQLGDALASFCAECRYALRLVLARQIVIGSNGTGRVFCVFQKRFLFIDLLDD